MRTASGSRGWMASMAWGMPAISAAPFVAFADQDIGAKATQHADQIGDQRLSRAGEDHVPVSRASAGRLSHEVRERPVHIRFEPVEAGRHDGKAGALDPWRKRGARNERDFLTRIAQETRARGTIGWKWPIAGWQVRRAFMSRQRFAGGLGLKLQANQPVSLHAPQEREESLAVHVLRPPSPERLDIEQRGHVLDDLPFLVPQRSRGQVTFESRPASLEAIDGRSQTDQQA
jgi:hypothetical protein